MELIDDDPLLLAKRGLCRRLIGRCPVALVLKLPVGVRIAEQPSEAFIFLELNLELQPQQIKFTYQRRVGPGTHVIRCTGYFGDIVWVINLNIIPNLYNFSNVCTRSLDDTGDDKHEEA